MKIVVLDGYTLNSGDLDWRGLQALGGCTFHDRTARDEIVDRTKGAEIVLTNKVPFDKATLEALPDLRYIGVTATGVNIIDVAAAKARGVTVTNVPAYSTHSVAQLVLALLLEITNRTGHYDQTVHAGRWQASADFCYYDSPIIALAGLTMGIVGFGDIGQAVAKIAHAFGMKILVHTRTQRDAGIPVEFCGLDDLFKQSDVITLHCPLTPETKELVNAQRLALMKASAYVINTSRGPLIHEQALADALNAGRIAGAGVDVLSAEPPRDGNPLLTAKNCVITPHIAWASVAARKKLMEVTVNNVRQFVKGQPENVVNP